MTETIDIQLRRVLGQVLNLDPARLAAVAPDSPLLGALPELDSMAIAILFGAIEDQFGLMFDDAELNGDTLQTYRSLLALVSAHVHR